MIVPGVAYEGLQNLTEGSGKVLSQQEAGGDGAGGVEGTHTGLNGLL